MAKVKNLFSKTAAEVDAARNTMFIQSHAIMIF